MSEIAQQFLNFYYTNFAQNRVSLGALYNQDSQMTFNGETFKGQQLIMEKFGALTFQQVQHNATNIVTQQSPTGLLIFVTGQLSLDNDQPLNFAQCFHLVQGPSGYLLTNDIFALS